MRLFLFILESWWLSSALKSPPRPIVRGAPITMIKMAASRMRVFNISTMLGDRDRGWWVVWTQSAVPRRVGARSV
jgi:hypothetical protein